MTIVDLPTATAAPIELSGHFNNTGIAASSWPTAGGFNIWANTFPAEALPAVGSTADVGGVKFRFPARNQDGADNIRCRGQLINLPIGRYDWLYLLAAAERRSEDLVELHYADGAVRQQWLRVSDFWPETATRFGEIEAYRCDRMLYPRHAQLNTEPVIWRTRIPVTVDEPLVGIRLPDNPAIHVFALTTLPAADLSATDSAVTA